MRALKQGVGGAPHRHQFELPNLQITLHCKASWLHLQVMHISPTGATPEVSAFAYLRFCYIPMMSPRPKSQGSSNFGQTRSADPIQVIMWAEGRLVFSG